MLPRPHIAEQESGDLALLDFLAAFGDAVAAVVAVDVFERLVARVAHAAMDLHGAVGGLAAQPVRPKIAHRDLVGERVLDLRLRQRSEEHTSELQSRQYLVCRLLLEKKKKHKT